MPRRSALRSHLVLAVRALRFLAEWADPGDVDPVTGRWLPVEARDAASVPGLLAGLAESALAAADARFPGPVERPPHWGGYRLVPRAVESWQGRPNRLHDRVRYRLDGAAWTIERLAP